MCSKCGVRPQREKHTWCAECFSAYQRDRRKNVLSPEKKPAPDVKNDTADEKPVTPEKGELPAPVTPCGLCSGKDAMILSLTAEVQTLKGQVVALLRAKLQEQELDERGIAATGKLAATVVGSRGPLSVKAAKKEASPWRGRPSKVEVVDAGGDTCSPYCGKLHVHSRQRMR